MRRLELSWMKRGRKRREVWRFERGKSRGRAARRVIIHVHLLEYYY